MAVVMVALYPPSLANYSRVRRFFGEATVDTVLTFCPFTGKNQAILPDDKEPTIVYDPVQKRWIDKNAPDSGPDAGPPPPPMMANFGGPAHGAGARSEPNSTVTSPVNQQNSFPTSPSFPSFQSASKMGAGGNGAPPPSAFPNAASTPLSNGAIPSLPTGFSSGPPAPPTGNQFRGSIRKNRYIDVFNGPPGGNSNNK